MHRFLVFLISLAFLPAVVSAQFLPVGENPYGERPVIVPVPATVAGVDAPVLSLSGGWQRADAGGSVRTGAPSAGPVSLSREVVIPPAFAGKRIILRFDNTTQAARLEVNGRFVRDYWGACGAWTADITDFVTPGQPALLSVRLERSPGLGAFVRFLPMIREASLYAVPERYLQRLRLTTDFDAQYRDAELEVWVKVSQPGGGSLRLSATGPDGRRLSLSPATVRLPEGMTEFKYKVKVRNPRRWDAEHPNLYDLTVSLLDGRGNVTQTLRERYGFREVELRGRQMFVNGQEVKFRGFWGGDSPEQLRSLNVNHTRQKWVTEDYLDRSDACGLYVLDENCVDFAKFGAETDPQYARQWLALIEEKLERDWNHPSVVMWGLGNESFNGPNVLATHKYVKAEDPQRPTMFSWANRIRPDEEIPYDIYSFHYAPAEADLADYGVSIWHSSSLLKERAVRPEMPVLVDEATHVCISTDELYRDPNVRNFWGESILDAWDRAWETPGSLGLDQFGLFRYLADDTPEIWNLRKAYSPVRIARRDYELPASGQTLSVELENRFCHTDLSELTVRWKAGGREGSLQGPSAAPRQRGVLRVPVPALQAGEPVELVFIDPSGMQVDEYRLSVGAEPFRLPAGASFAPTVEQDEREAVIRGRGFELRFNKYSGQISSFEYKGETVLTGGPHLQLLRSGIDVGEFWPQSSRIYVQGNEAVIEIEAIYSPIPVSFRVGIDGEGAMTVRYTVRSLPHPAPDSVILPWNGTDTGGFSEVGVKFILPAGVDRLQWDRRGLWTVYPDDHIGRERGEALRQSAGEPSAWKDWNTDHYWNDAHWSISNPGRQEASANDFRSSKEFIRTASVLLGGTSLGVQVLSEEKDAVRLEASRPDGPVTLVINNQWNYPTLGIGNYMKAPILLEDGYTDVVHLRPVDIAE
ncbi:MAG: hypothetical protein K5910_03645 [Bacteroidales bacterium]|nr:hypothetical protein [Bacteroidales bacterium]